MLIASDDEYLADTISQKIKERFPLGTIEYARSETSISGAGGSSCDLNCISPALDTISAFSRAQALVLSLDTQFGRTLLSAWSGKNFDQVPLFVDLNGRVKRKDLLQGAPSSKYLCRVDVSPSELANKGGVLCGAPGGGGGNGGRSYSTASTRSALDEMMDGFIGIRSLAAEDSGSSGSKKSHTTHVKSSSSSSKQEGTATAVARANGAHTPGQKPADKEALKAECREL